MGKCVTDYKPDRSFWNIAKGIGIIAIIIGHCVVDPVANYLYMFHIQLFFFISGYLFNEKKYGEDPWINVKNKIKGLWLPYFIINTLFVLLHNLFIVIGMQPEGTERYNWYQIIEKICQGMFGISNEFLMGPVWFLRTLAMAMILLGFIVYLSILLEKKLGFVCKILFQLIVISLITVVGYIFVQSHYQLPADMQISFVVMPYIWAGYTLRNYVGDIRKYLNPIIGIICFILVGVVSIYNDLDITMGNVFPYMYLVAFMGIYGCLYLSKLFAKWRISNKVMAFIGSISLYIMATHFFVIRLIDCISCAIIGKNAYEVIYSIPMWIVYAIVVCVVSILFSYVVKWIADKVIKLFIMNKEEIVEEKK